MMDEAVIEGGGEEGEEEEEQSRQTGASYWKKEKMKCDRTS